MSVIGNGFSEGYSRQPIKHNETPSRTSCIMMHNYVSSNFFKQGLCIAFYNSRGKVIFQGKLNCFPRS
ncbi:hypothetical protein SADUNF_Sadunf10G0122000 [Salix dunnii]|uniref:Uncharacterized protein n=1 Tax=Salix dunnii TaxID=1413687 RepID=A0A835JNA2_9ROSI|nr:hypothetical protein SADUNF_Sadunf10G0122000 [Salix dunnii]